MISNVGEFAFERNRYVEDQVCVSRTFYYAKIVNGKTTVQIAGDFFNLASHFIDLLVVCDNGINVDGGRTIQFVLKLMLNVVNLIMDDQKISVGGNLSVEGKNQSAWTVVWTIRSCMPWTRGWQERSLQFPRLNFFPGLVREEDQWYPSL